MREYAVMKDSCPHLPDDISVYDTTLRDGEQMPGLSFSLQQKLSIARMLDEMGVHQIEAGFPAVSPNEKKMVKAIKKEGLNAKILSLSRLNREDIDAVIDCDIDMVLLFIASSNTHLEHKLHLTREEVKERTYEAITYAKQHGLITSFSTEDSTRSDLEFLKELYTIAQEAGADRIGLTDTLGCATPDGIKYLIEQIRPHVHKPISIHLHNDFGLALSNALMSVCCGASAMATTVGGIGERSGNVPLEEFVVAMKVLFGRDLGIDTERHMELAKMVYRYCGIPIPKIKPLIGENAFAHESGIHVAAVLSEPTTYESIRPEMVGNKRKLILGKHTGTAAIKSKLSKMGIVATTDEISDILGEVKKIGEINGNVGESKFLEIVKNRLESENRPLTPP